MSVKTTFTEFRRNAAKYFNAVEQGDTIIVFRYGKAIAEIIPASKGAAPLSWKQPGLRLSIKGISLSREILKERKQNR